MTPQGTVAVLVLLLTNGATAVAALLSIRQWRHNLQREHDNRRVMLERWLDDVNRYHHRLRAYLRELADQGVIDMERVDLSQFPPPPLPRYNGDPK